MAQDSDKGSILLKLLIIVLAVALIIVIKIPAKIWNEEDTEKARSEYNMSSIYEAERYYNRLTKKFTTDKDILLAELKKDSTLSKVQELVNYTQELRHEIDSYFDVPFVKSLQTISQNISTITQDLITNQRYFKSDKDILNEADQLSLKLSMFTSDVKYPNYAMAVTFLDSLYELRRDLSDYSLQTAASRSAFLTEKINSVLNGVETDQFKSEWSDLFTRLDTFRKTVDESEISSQTSVGARIKEFSGKINNALDDIAKGNKSDDITSANAINQKMGQTYQNFLSDYIVTSKPAQFRLAMEDSMVLYITDENFDSPVSGEPYKLLINNDSSDIKIESPMLLEELREKAKPIADKINTLDFIPYYQAYLDTLESIDKKGIAIKQGLRRNIEITVKNKEIEERIKKYRNGSEYSAAKDLLDFVNITNTTQSYSELTEYIEKARSAIGIFEQVYGGNLFDNIDSLQADITKDLEEYNSILSEIRRLPKGITPFNNENDALNQIVQSMKKQSSSTGKELFNSLNTELDNALLFANEGKTVRVYGVFEKSLQNFGYVNKSTKSWEEEKK